MLLLLYSQLIHMDHQSLLQQPLHIVHPNRILMDLRKRQFTVLLVLLQLQCHPINPSKIPMVHLKHQFKKPTVLLSKIHMDHLKLP